MLMSNKDVIFRILDSYFKTRKNQFDKSQIKDISVLIETTDMFKLVNEKQAEINIKSISFNEIFLEYIENNQGQKNPHNIKDSFILIEKFEKQKKTEFGYSNIVNAYSTLIDGIKSYIFYLFHVKGIVNVFDYFKALCEEEQHLYDEYLLETILLIDIDIETIYDVLSLLKSNDTITRVPDFCSKLGETKPQLAHDLYDYALPKKDKNDAYILSNLLIGLFESDTEKAFSKTIDLLTANPSTAYFTLGRLKYQQEKHIRECFDVAEKIDISDSEGLLQVPYIYKSLIENSNTPVEIREKCFSKMQELFLIDNEQLRNTIFTSCRFIQGYEKERYRLLVETFLSKTQNYYNKISDYFRHFTNPDYFFHLFTMLYDVHYRNKGTMIDIHVFSGALSHFWNTNRDKTEVNLLYLLSHDVSYLRIGAVDLIRSKHLGLYDVNLLGLAPEINQLRALEALFFQSFYNIDDFLPLILTLRNSPYKKVVVYLQAKLSELIRNSYHDHLYEKTMEYVQDESFLKPLKESVDSYHKMKKGKTAIDDLNPCQNEHDLMNLYYNLEREEQQKMMHKTHNADNSFLSMIRKTTIVRGHAWKMGDNDVRPLGHIERAFALDLNMYKNPDLFNYTHHTFNSEF